MSRGTPSLRSDALSAQSTPSLRTADQLVVVFLEEGCKVLRETDWQNTELKLWVGAGGGGAGVSSLLAFCTESKLCVGRFPEPWGNS